MNELHEKIEEIPGDEGFWKGAEAYHRWGEILYEKGFHTETIIQILSDLYWAAASEYGA